MDGFRFDHLTRLVGSRLSRRSGLALLVAAGMTPFAPATAKKSKKIKICYKGKTRRVKKQDWKKRYKGASKKPNCGASCCNDDACFAEAVNPDNQQPTGFDCCPAELFCPSPKAPFPDQCCYPDETCNPSLANDPQAETICCRPCNGTCCLKQNEECINGTCTLVDTARLPRTRRG